MQPCSIQLKNKVKKKRGGLPTPKKALPGAPPPSSSLLAGLDELAWDKRLCGATMKGLLTILHPPEALPAGHRLPECHSLSRSQSQHASLPFSTYPCQLLSPTQIVMLMIINAVMKVTQSEKVTRWCVQGGVICTFYQQRPQFGWSGFGLVSVLVVRCGCASVWAFGFWFFFLKDLRCVMVSPFQPSGSIVWLGAMTTTRALLRSLYPADLSSCVISSVWQNHIETCVLWRAAALKPARFASGWVASIKVWILSYWLFFLGRIRCHIMILELRPVASGQWPGNQWVRWGL